MNFCCHDHQGKSLMLVQALLDAGHKRSLPNNADLLLIDIDDPAAPRRTELIDRCPGRVMLYPHGGIPSANYGDHTPDPRIEFQLVHGPGGARMVSDREAVEIGWSYSPSVPFSTVEKPRRVLFGPIHPLGNGQLDNRYREINRRVFGILQASGLDVQVQMYRDATTNGLPVGTPAVRSSLNIGWSAIDQADIVVAEGTLACLALARGKPVIMFGQENPRYPVDIDDGDLEDLIVLACSGAGEPWREHFVGGPFDQDAFLQAVESSVAVAA